MKEYTEQDYIIDALNDGEWRLIKYTMSISAIMVNMNSDFHIDMLYAHQWHLIRTPYSLEENSTIIFACGKSTIVRDYTYKDEVVSTKKFVDTDLSTINLYGRLSTMDLCDICKSLMYIYSDHKYFPTGIKKIDERYY